MDKNINPQLKEIYDRVMNTPTRSATQPARPTISAPQPTAQAPVIPPAPPVSQFTQTTTVVTPAADPQSSLDGIYHPPVEPTPHVQATPALTSMDDITSPVMPPASTPATPPNTGFVYSAQTGQIAQAPSMNPGVAAPVSMEKVEPASKKMTVLIIIFLSTFVIAYTVFWFLVFGVVQI